MKSYLSLLTILVTTLFTLMLPIGIDCCECCSYTTTQIISVMSRPDFERDPCYIEWKADQDVKWHKLMKQRDELEKSIKEGHANQHSSWNTRNTYTSATRATPIQTKEPSTWLVLAIIVGILSGICCCGVCITIYLNEDESTALTTTTTPRNDVNTAGNTAVAMTPASFYSLPTNNVSVIETENRPFFREANVPLLPRGLMNRQNSLPSYDDALRMPSAPPKE